LNPKEAFELVVNAMPKDQLDVDLARKVSDTLLIGIIDDKVTDIVLAEMSKLVEIRLRGIFEQFTGDKLAEGGNFGQRLLEALEDVGLIAGTNGNPEYVYFLLKWYFGERNPPHHSHDTYEIETFLSYWLMGNHILREFEERQKSLPRAISMTVDISPAVVVRGMFFTVSARINRPDGTTVERGRVEGVTTFGNKSQRSTRMTFSLSDKNWSSQVYTSGDVPGDFTVRIFAEEGDERWVSKTSAKGKIVPYPIIDTQPRAE